MKRLLSTVAISTMILTIASPAFAKEGSVQLADQAKSAVLIERDTGNILYDKNSDEKLPPASMTKIMTMLLIMEEIDKGQLKMDEKVRTSEHAASMGGSQIFLEPGEEMTQVGPVEPVFTPNPSDNAEPWSEDVKQSAPGSQSPEEAVSNIVQTLSNLTAAVEQLGRNDEILGEQIVKMQGNEYEAIQSKETPPVVAGPDIGELWEKLPEKVQDALMKVAGDIGEGVKYMGMGFAGYEAPAVEMSVEERVVRKVMEKQRTDIDAMIERRAALMSEALVDPELEVWMKRRKEEG